MPQVCEHDIETDEACEDCFIAEHFGGLTVDELGEALREYDRLWHGSPVRDEVITAATTGFVADERPTANSGGA